MNLPSLEADLIASLVGVGSLLTLRTLFMRMEQLRP